MQLRLTNSNCFAAIRRLGLRKTVFGLTPSAQFFFATVWARVVAAQRPITCPNRQLLRTLCEIGANI